MIRLFNKLVDWVNGGNLTFLKRKRENPQSREGTDTPNREVITLKINDKLQLCKNTKIKLS